MTAGGLAAAEVGRSNTHRGATVAAPSKLDYMVLASFVNNPHLISMAGYRSTTQQGAITPEHKSAPNGKPAVDLPPSP